MKTIRLIIVNVFVLCAIGIASVAFADSGCHGDKPCPPLPTPAQGCEHATHNPHCLPLPTGEPPTPTAIQATPTDIPADPTATDAPDNPTETPVVEPTNEPEKPTPTGLPIQPTDVPVKPTDVPANPTAVPSAESTPIPLCNACVMVRVELCSGEIVTLSVKSFAVTTGE